MNQELKIGERARIYVAAIHHGNRTLAKLYEIEDRLIELEKRVAALAERIRTVHLGQEQ